MNRIYDKLVAEHIAKYEQMLFLVGPRQVGKTTISKNASQLAKNYIYLNWDSAADQSLILSGEAALVEKLKLDEAVKVKKIISLDEIHKYKEWRNYLKGLYDKYNDKLNFIVTGSAKLSAFRQTGDSLMGRYLLYNVHPFSVRELLDSSLAMEEIRNPVRVDGQVMEDLIRYGGFPAPLLKQDQRFYNRWSKLRSDQLFEEDIRTITRIQEIAQLKLLSRLLKEQVGQLTNYTNLAQKVRVTIPTIESWISTLQAFYYCFLMKPWSNNIARALIKTPKLYLWDWSELEDIGAKYENMVASHLKKAVDFWNDSGIGTYELFFIRDKEKNEVDFLVTKNSKPWFLVEVKASASAVSKSLYQFQEQTKAQHAFQVVFDMPYIDKNCFDYTKPVIVPASTFLSQLI